ncbi:MAG: hypothetical protein ABIH65_00575 [Nanoarchaeota archaeon]
MIGLRFKLSLENKVLEKIELRNNCPGTEIRDVGELKIHPTTYSQLIQLNFHEASKIILQSYYHKLMSNEKLRLSVNSFLYDPD